ncbi:MAG: methyltransferase family protein [Nitrospiria bacterium]
MQKFNQLIGHYRTFISLLLAIVILVFAKPTLYSIAWGLPFIIMGEFIRTWSAGCINKEYEQLTTWGPYAYTRNPLYIGNFLLGLGFVMMGNQWITIVLFLVIFFLIYRATIMDEEKSLFKVFGESFSEYKKSVPRFFPRFSSHTNEKQNFYWKRVIKHREYKAWMGILGILFFIFIKSRL